jgi:hypothetical protein
LEIAVFRIGGAELGREGGGVREAGRNGGGAESLVEVDGEVERNVHPVRKRNRAVRGQAWSWIRAWHPRRYDDLC